MASRLTTRADKTSTCGSAAPDERDHRQERFDGLAQIAAQCGNVAQVAAQLAEQLAAYWPPHLLPNCEEPCQITKVKQKI